MAKFRYRMQNILDIKQKLEEAAKMEFAEANARVMEEEEKLSLLHGRRREYEAEGKMLRKQQMHVPDIQHNIQALDVLRDMIKEQIKAVERAKQIQEEKRLALQSAMQERKTQEKLYENAFAEFIQEENAKESREVDELTSYKYGVQRRVENNQYEV
jgi:flagellar FliJ protein